MFDFDTWSFLSEKLLGSRMRAHGRRLQKDVRERLKAHATAQKALQEKDAEQFAVSFQDQMEAIQTAANEVEEVGQGIFKEEGNLLYWTEEEIDDVSRVVRSVRGSNESFSQPPLQDKAQPIGEIMDKNIAAVESNEKKWLSWVTRLEKGEKPINISRKEIAREFARKDTGAREMYNASRKLRNEMKSVKKVEKRVESAEGEMEQGVAHEKAEDIEEAKEMMVNKLQKLHEEIEEFEKTATKFFTYTLMELFSFLRSQENLLDRLEEQKGEFLGFTQEHIPEMRQAYNATDEKVETIIAERDFEEKIRKIISLANEAHTEVNKIAR